MACRRLARASQAIKNALAGLPQMTDGRLTTIHGVAKPSVAQMLWGREVLEAMSLRRALMINLIGTKAANKPLGHGASRRNGR